MNRRPSRRLARRIAATAAMRAERVTWMAGIADKYAEMVSALEDKLNELVTPHERAQCTLQWAGAMSSWFCEGIAIGAVTGTDPGVEKAADWLLNLCREAVESVATDDMCRQVLDILLRGIREVIAEDGIPLIVAIDDISRSLSWHTELFDAIQRRNIRRIRALKCGAPCSAAALNASIYDQEYRRAFDRMRSRKACAIRVADDVLDRRLEELHRNHRRRGPPCRLTTSRNTRCAPTGANAPPQTPPGTGRRPQASSPVI